MSTKRSDKVIKLKEIRVRKGITQEEIANFLGVKQVTVSRYETEQRMLNQDQINKLSLFLDVTPNELLGFDEVYKNYVEYLMSLKKTDFNA